MSLLGKILAVLNVLAAMGLVYLLALDMGQRQRWAYDYFLHDLFINGLPLDDKEQEGDIVKVTRLNPPTSDLIFQKKYPVQTQMEEVERVKEILRGSVDAAGGAKEQRLARILLPLATTLTERQELLRRAQAPGLGKTEDLEKKLDDAFSQVQETWRTPRQPGDPANRR